MANLNRLEVVAVPEQAELVSALLALKVSYGWEEDLLPSGGQRFIIHAHEREFCLELRSELLACVNGLRFELSSVPELDWVSSWKEFFTPVEVGSRFVVLAPWMEEERRASLRLPVIIEPKSAFGTGHHASTALCLTAVSDLYDAGRIRPGDSFLDLGTGSGILGIGTALLGMKGLGVDPDPVAVENAVGNRALNGLAADAFEVKRGSVEVVSGDHFHLIVANILAEPLLGMAKSITGLLRPGGALVLSGILDRQASMLEAAYGKCGLPPARIIRKDEWVALVWGYL